MTTYQIYLLENQTQVIMKIVDTGEVKLIINMRFDSKNFKFKEFVQAFAGQFNLSNSNINENLGEKAYRIAEFLENEGNFNNIFVVREESRPYNNLEEIDDLVNEVKWPLIYFLKSFKGKTDEEVNVMANFIGDFMAFNNVSNKAISESAYIYNTYYLNFLMYKEYFASSINNYFNDNNTYGTLEEMVGNEFLDKFKNLLNILKNDLQLQFLPSDVRKKIKNVNETILNFSNNISNPVSVEKNRESKFDFWGNFWNIVQSITKTSNRAKARTAEYHMHYHYHAPYSAGINNNNVDLDNKNKKDKKDNKNKKREKVKPTPKQKLSEKDDKTTNPVFYIGAIGIAIIPAIWQAFKAKMAANLREKYESRILHLINDLEIINTGLIQVPYNCTLNNKYSVAKGTADFVKRNTILTDYSFNQVVELARTLDNPLDIKNIGNMLLNNFSKRVDWKYTFTLIGSIAGSFTLAFFGNVPYSPLLAANFVGMSILGIGKYLFNFNSLGYFKFLDGYHHIKDINIHADNLKKYSKIEAIFDILPINPISSIRSGEFRGGSFKYERSEPKELKSISEEEINSLYTTYTKS
ncbi:MAG: hypothetical protein J0H68_00530 [Sphingobacteriia bacterium]|nr:hypothetical protein [Sphingobacteriia bacterium]